MQWAWLCPETRLTRRFPLVHTHRVFAAVSGGTSLTKMNRPVPPETDGDRFPACRRKAHAPAPISPPDPAAPRATAMVRTFCRLHRNMAKGPRGR